MARIGTMLQNMHILVVCSILLHFIPVICSSNVEAPVSTSKPKDMQEMKTYAGWQVLRVVAPSQRSLRQRLMPHLEQESDVEVLNVLPRDGGYSVDLLVKPNVRPKKILPEEFQADLSGQRNELNFPGWSQVLADLGQAIERQIENSEGEEFGWNGFYRYNVIRDFLKSLAHNFSSVNLVNIGKSLNNRTIDAVIISNSPDKMLRKFNRRYHKRIKEEKINMRLFDGDDQVHDVNREDRSMKNKKRKNRKTKKNEKPVIFIEAGIHAREWISPAVATYLAKQLVESDSSFLKHASWIIVPVANPDGYEYTHTDDRMWRKNLRVTENSFCSGVDLNRNWDHAFGKRGASKDFCSGIYHGTHAFSEPETQAVRDLVMLYKSNIKLYLSLHCYGSVILYPWSHTYKKAPDDKKLWKFAVKMAENLNKKGRNQYKVQQSSAMYPAAGVSDDWAYSQGIPYAYTIELPDRGRDGFLTSADKILPIAQQVWEGLRCQMDHLLGTKMC